MERETERPTTFAVFVGREVELARLGEMVAEVPATVVVGVPGVGKSALAEAFAARWSGSVVRQRVSGAPAALLIDDMRRQLARDSVVDELDGDDARAADLARRLAAVDGLWLLDDFHRLPAADQSRILDAFTAAAGPARLVATSRQVPPPRAGLGDHAQLRLEPLAEPGGRELWSALDELYGVSDRFDVAWQRSHGLPILLRQAHAGGFDQDDPIAGAVRALDDDERWLAGALALAEVALPAESLLALRPAARAALRRLVSRFVVDIDGAGGCTLHDLFAASVGAALDGDERRTLHVVVAHAL
ncbi:MAG TPA: AAA family ATPase, partial [Polyangia bacterium]